MIAAIVAPLGSCNIFSTVDCLDNEDTGDFDDAVLAGAFDPTVGFGRGGTLVLVVRFAEMICVRSLRILISIC
jgi:hypothetical protein